MSAKIATTKNPDVPSVSLAWRHPILLRSMSLLGSISAFAPTSAVLAEVVAPQSVTTNHTSATALVPETISPDLAGNSNAGDDLPEATRRERTGKPIPAISPIPVVGSNSTTDGVRSPDLLASSPLPLQPVALTQARPTLAIPPRARLNPPVVPAGVRQVTSLPTLANAPLRVQCATDTNGNLVGNCDAYRYRPVSAPTPYVRPVGRAVVTTRVPQFNRQNVSPTVPTASLRQVTLNQVNPSRTVVNRTIAKPVAINNAPIGYRPMAIPTNSNRFNTPAAPVLRFRPQPRPVTTAQMPQSIEIAVPAPRTYAIPNVGRIPSVATGRNVPNISPIPTLQAPYIAQSGNPLDAFPRSAPLPPAYLNTSDFVYPLAVPAPISSRYGWRIHPITGTRRFHTGMDLAAPMGAPVVAAISGRVVTADWLGGYGKAIVIQDGQNRQVLYGHLSEIMVGEGQIVEKGTIIGRVGSTGNSTGPHLHFEARTPSIDGSWVTLDPSTNVQYALGNLRRAMQNTNRTSY